MFVQIDISTSRLQDSLIIVEKIPLIQYMYPKTRLNRSQITLLAVYWSLTSFFPFWFFGNELEISIFKILEEQY
jgi:hypothetical protein